MIPNQDASLKTFGISRKAADPAAATAAHRQAKNPGSFPPVAADRHAAWIVTGIAFLMYVATAARDVTGEDAGELVAAAKLLGIAHPPGYPLWCLLGKVCTWIPVGSIAFRVTLLSAAGAAATAGLVCHLAIRLTGARAASVAAALLLAFSRDLWSQAVIPEVYTLNTAFLAAALWLAWRWHETRSPRTLCLLAATLGLSLTNHNTMGPLCLFFAGFVLSVHWNLWRERGLPFLALLLFALPLLLYFYLPIRAEAATLINWGNPQDLSSVVDHVSRKQYSFEFTAAARTPARTLAQALAVAREVVAQLTPWLALLPLTGAILLFRRDLRFATLLAAIFGATTLGFVVLLNFDLEREKLTAYRLFYIPSYVVAALWTAETLRAAGALACRVRPLPIRLSWAACALAAIPLLAFWRENDKSHYRVVRAYLEATLITLPPNALIFPSGDHASFPLIYAQGVERRRLDIAIADKYGYTDPVLLRDMPASLRVGASRIPTQADDARYQDWLIANSTRPVYLTTKRSMAGLPGYKLVPEGFIYRVVRPGEVYIPREDLWSRFDLTFLGDLPRDYTADVVAAEVLLARGSYRAASGDRDGARADFTASGEASRGVKQGLNNIGSACAEAGLAEDAVRWFEAALALDGGYKTALRNLVRVQTGLRRWEDAMKTIDRLLALDPKDRGARYQLVDLHRASGQKRLAILELDKLANDEPSNPGPLEAAGSLSLEEGDSLGALTYFQRALALAPDRLDLLETVQSILQGGAAMGDPFGGLTRPRVPRPPNPLDGLLPPGYGRDPLRLGPRR